MSRVEEKVYVYDPVFVVFGLIVGVAAMTNVILIVRPKRKLDKSLGGWKLKRVINWKERTFALIINAIAVVWLYSRYGWSWYTWVFIGFFNLWALSLILLLRDQD